jgi:hypothetical protein
MSNTIGATSKAAAVYPPEHLSSTSGFCRVRVAQSLVFCVVLCKSLHALFLLVIVLHALFLLVIVLHALFLLVIVLHALFRFTASDPLVSSHFSFLVGNH